MPVRASFAQSAPSSPSFQNDKRPFHPLNFSPVSDDSNHRQPLRVRRRHRVRQVLLYSLAILTEFRWTLVAMGSLLAVGAVLYYCTPHVQFDGKRPDLLTAAYGAWMAMLAQ